MTDNARQQGARAVGHRCLCFAAQRAARALARRFDEVFRAEGVTNGQFSILVALSAGTRRTPSELAAALGMDRATLSVALKPLVRRGFVAVAPDSQDARRRRLALTQDGVEKVSRLMPIWQHEHEALEAEIEDATGFAPTMLRRSLQALSGIQV